MAATRRLVHTWAGTLAALAVGLALAGCGSSSNEPGVASANGGSASTAATPTPTATGDRDAQLRAFAGCMREHGVDVPDPQPGGGGMAANLNPSAPGFASAYEACKAKLPNGGAPPKLDPQQVEQYRAFASCMRDNGVDLPDPGPDGTLQFDAGSLARFDTSNPTFQKAIAACRDKLTGLLARRTGGAS